LHLSSFKGAEALAMALLWVMLFPKWDAPNHEGQGYIVG